MGRYSDRAAKLRTLAAELLKWADELDGLAPKRPAKAPERPQDASTARGWVGVALDLWKAKVGEIAPGRLGKALAPLVQVHGWEALAVPYRAYLDERPYQRRDGSIWGDLPTDGPHNTVVPDTRWMSPEDFTKNFHFWRNRCQPVVRPTNSPTT